MKLDAIIYPHNLKDVPGWAQHIEELGFDGAWTAETQHDAFLPLAVAAAHTNKLELGTAIATAFSRSPMSLAYIAWDLATTSEGRFMLGLGTQVKAHNERRFSVEWGQPVARMRDAILGLRAIWASWQSGERLNYRGEFYQFTLMTPFFTPPASDGPDISRIPIYIAGVNTGLATLAGELCEGFHAHPYHSVEYLREVVQPAVHAGEKSAGRQQGDTQISCAVFVITGRDDSQLATNRESVRRQISFYASTPTYISVMAHHGWAETGEKLSMLAARKKWDEMPALITDEMLDKFAVTAPPGELASKVIERYRGVLDRITYYMPFVPGEMDDFWAAAVTDFHTEA